MTIDIPNAFAQTDIPKDEKSMIMKTRGRMIDMLLKIDHDKHEPFACESEKSKTLCVRMKKALCGMLVSSMLCCKKFRKDIERTGHKVNPCCICVASKIARKKQHAIAWHVDDVKCSHAYSEVNDDFAKWVEKTYGGDSGHVKVHRGKRHDYLGMILDYSTPKKLQVDMRHYTDQMIED